MKKLPLGMIAAASVTVSMVAACNLSAPSKPTTDTEGVVGGKGNTGNSVVAPATGNTTGQTGAVTNNAGDATVTGKVLDQAGMPVQGAIVTAGANRVLSAADGSYTIRVASGDAVNIKIAKDGYILRDATLPVAKGETLAITSSMVKADEKVTRISAAAGGTAVSSDGASELIFPAGALSKDTDVRVTWLNPREGSAPAAFHITALADTPATGGAEDAAAAPSAPAGPNVTELNTSDLPGPLETKAYGDRKYFSPVAFAGVSLSSPLKDGETATLRMAVSDKVLADMKAQGDLKDSDLGQDLFPCFSWSADASTWDKPALSKVVKDENGKYWFEYTVRANAMAPAAGQYKALAIGDAQGSTQVELVVGGGRRVVDGTYTYGALIERSSSDSFNNHGFKNVYMRGGANWTTSGGNYRAPNRDNLYRPDVKTDSYSGTTYAGVMGAQAFSDWDREGAFRLAFPPGERFELNSPTIFGIRATNADATGTTAASTGGAIASTYVKPFYYDTDASLTLTLTGIVTAAEYELTYTLDGASKTTKATPSNSQLKFTFARNASASAQRFVLKGLVNPDSRKDETQNVSVDLPVGGNKSATVKMVANGAK